MKNLFRWPIFKFVLFASILGFAHIVHAQSPNNRPAYPEDWAEFLSDWAEVRTQFLTHIKKAKNIKFPIGPKEFDWKVDWKAQQIYCKNISRIIFKHPEKMQILLPDAIAARDGIVETRELVGHAFEKCTATERDMYGKQVIARRPVISAQSTMKSDLYYKQEAYFVGTDYFLRSMFLRNDDGLLTSWIGYYSDKNHYCPLGAKGGPNFDPLASISVTEEGNKQFNYRQTLFLKILGEMVAVEFGTYAPRPRDRDMPDTRWGRSGQKYIFIKSLRHEIWGDWALTSTDDTYEHSEGEDENYTKSSAQAACVINFSTK